MAEICLQPPNPFNFKVPDEWPQWRCHCEQFHASSGLQDASASKQVIMLYCLGEEAESMLKSTNITKEETKNYETVLEKFDSFFQVIIFKRVRFNHGCQLPDEQWNSISSSYATWWNIVITGTLSKTASY